MDYAIGIAQEAEKRLTIPILISGDTHHYSRYVANDGTQFVTSGGGGAFLHPTHQLEQNIQLKWLGKKTELSLGEITASSDKERKLDAPRAATNSWQACTSPVVASTMSIVAPA